MRTCPDCDSSSGRCLHTRCAPSAGEEVTMEGKCAAGGGADLLMECDEEEQEVWSPSPETDEEEEEEDEGVELEEGVCSSRHV